MTKKQLIKLLFLLEKREELGRTSFEDLQRWIMVFAMLRELPFSDAERWKDF